MRPDIDSNHRELQRARPARGNSASPPRPSRPSTMLTAPFTTMRRAATTALAACLRSDALRSLPRHRGRPEQDRTVARRHCREQERHSSGLRFFARDSRVRYPIPERIFDYVSTVQSATAGTCHNPTSDRSRGHYALVHLFRTLTRCARHTRHVRR
jgi:hypothetical protein